MESLNQATEKFDIWSFLKSFMTQSFQLNSIYWIVEAGTEIDISEFWRNRVTVLIRLCETVAKDVLSGIFCSLKIKSQVLSGFKKNVMTTPF